MVRERRGVLRTLPGMAAVDLYWLPLGAGGHFVRLTAGYVDLVLRGLRPD